MHRKKAGIKGKLTFLVHRTKVVGTEPDKEMPAVMRQVEEMKRKNWNLDKEMLRVQQANCNGTSENHSFIQMSLCKQRTLRGFFWDFGYWK